MIVAESSIRAHSRASGNPVRYVLLWLTAFSAAVFSPLFLNAAEVNLEVSPRRITVGDPVELNIAINPPAGANVVWPSGEQFAPAEVIKMDTSSSKTERKEIRYTLSLFEPGEKELPDLPILLVAASKTDTIWVDPGAIEVQSVSSGQDSSLKDIRPPVRLPWTLKEAAPFIIGALAAISLMIAGYFLWRKAKLRKGEIPVYVPPPPPPDVVALRKLEELRVRKLWQDGRIKDYHSELTDIVKEYIGALYDLNALDMTTEELLEVRARWARDEESLARIRRILNIADMVKFAKSKPEPHDHEKSLELAFAYVEATRPQPAVLNPAGRS